MKIAVASELLCDTGGRRYFEVYSTETEEIKQFLSFIAHY